MVYVLCTTFYAIFINKYFQIIPIWDLFQQKYYFFGKLTTKFIRKTSKLKEKTHYSREKLGVWEALAPYLSPSDVKKKPALDIRAVFQSNNANVSLLVYFLCGRLCLVKTFVFLWPWPKQIYDESLFKVFPRQINCRTKWKGPLITGQ